jgi:hypothetical protein
VILPPLVFPGQYVGPTIHHADEEDFSTVRTTICRFANCRRTRRCRSLLRLRSIRRLARRRRPTTFRSEQLVKGPRLQGTRRQLPL